MFWLENAAATPRELFNNSRVVYEPASVAQLACVAATRPLVDPVYTLEVVGAPALNQSSGALVRWYHPEAPLFAGVATHISLSSGGAGLCLNNVCSLMCNASAGGFNSSTEELRIWIDGARNLIIIAL